MAIDDEIHFVAGTPIGPAGSWDYSAVTAMSLRSVPEIFLGDQQSILRGDQYRLWLRWFFEGLVSPLAIARNAALERLDVYAVVLKRIELLYPMVDSPRRRDLTEKITDHIFAEVERIRLSVARDFADKATKLALLAERTPPRCYICGFAFSKGAQDAFLRVKGREAVRLPKLVDVFRPRLLDRDISIEIEHVVPVAAGGHGLDNLRLACGWCNKHKSSKVSLYEASHVPPKIPGFHVGAHQIHELPHPFWTIRILALRGQCRHSAGCDRTAKTAELFISLLDWQGSPNPMNLTVFCQEHDPIAADRFHAASKVAELWGERR
ncbi:HNH endonuclease [Mesorhizobium sp. LCM 4577]|uniref:HNH endonuclease n=1 Tax=Mesorhizobium sp. LCM 4577 TaxID=1848288 RepID=UPI0009F43E64|nr:HNH endonuclease [Mesorhizobium sp. LCM 4577]